MSEPYLSEVRMLGFNFAPHGWALCDGQILPIQQHQSLYSLLGTMYGGDGRTTFGLPDLRGRVPVHFGNSNTPGSTNLVEGQKGGEDTHTLQIPEMPSHTHVMAASQDTANTANPQGQLPARAVALVPTPYTATNASYNISLAAEAIASVGGQAHQNMQPFTVVYFAIALTGLFPSRN